MFKLQNIFNEYTGNEIRHRIDFDHLAKAFDSKHLDITHENIIPWSNLSSTYDMMLNQCLIIDTKFCIKGQIVELLLELVSHYGIKYLSILYTGNFCKFLYKLHRMVHKKPPIYMFSERKRIEYTEQNKTNVKHLISQKVDELFINTERLGNVVIHGPLFKNNKKIICEIVSLPYNKNNEHKLPFRSECIINTSITSFDINVVGVNFDAKTIELTPKYSMVIRSPCGTHYRELTGYFNHFDDFVYSLIKTLNEEDSNNVFESMNTEISCSYFAGHNTATSNVIVYDKSNSKSTQVVNDLVNQFIDYETEKFTLDKQRIDSIGIPELHIDENKF